MKYSYSLLSLLGLALAGCEKDETVEVCTGSCTVIEGRLLTANGTAAIADVPLTVRWVNTNGGRSSDTRKKTVGTTNAKGEYRLSFFVQDDELHQGYFRVEYSVDKKRYYDMGSDITFMELPRDTTVKLDYLIPRKAYLLLALSNPAAVPANAYWTTFTSPYGVLPCPVSSGRGAGPAISWPLTGQANPVEVPADQPMVATHSKLKAGVRTFSYDTLSVPAGSTRTYTATF